MTTDTTPAAIEALTQRLDSQDAIPSRTEVSAIVRALAAELATARAERDALRKEVERLRAALEPLAAMADRYDPDEGDDGNLECWSGLAVPKIHHLREARAALTAEPLVPTATADDFGGEA